MNILCVTLHPSLDKVLRVKRLNPERANRAVVEMVYGGGKGNNVARALTRLGVANIATGFQGGHTGDFLTQLFIKESIKTEFIVCAQPTRTSIILHEDETGHKYGVYEPGQEVTLRESRKLVRKCKSLLSSVNLCLLCGSGQTPTASKIFAKIVAEAKGLGIKCVVDSSGDALSRSISSCPYMIKINKRELSGFYGRELSSLDEQMSAMIELQKKGIELVAITLGEEGILLTNGEIFLKGSLSMENIVNVIGCGDSAMAGMAKALVEDKSPADIVRWGVACGAANTQVLGSGFIESGMVMSLLPKVEVGRVIP